MMSPDLPSFLLAVLPGILILWGSVLCVVNQTSPDPWMQARALGYTSLGYVLLLVLIPWGAGRPGTGLLTVGMGTWLGLIALLSAPHIWDGVDEARTRGRRAHALQAGSASPRERA